MARWLLLLASLAPSAAWPSCSRRAFLAGFPLPVAAFIAADPAAAAYGSAPKLNIQDAQATPSRAEVSGPAVFDADGRAKELKAKVTTEWERISGKVHASLDKGKAKDLRDAESVLLLSMGNIKSGMREVAKVALGGDILVRDRGIAKFDYQSGQFTYKEVAQLPEDIFAAVNNCYLSIKKKDIEAANKEIAQADKAYATWVSLLQ